MAGTFPLPEAQLDRFMMRVSIGYPSDASEVDILRAQREFHPIRDLQPVMDGEHLMRDAGRGAARLRARLPARTTCSGS